MSQTATTATIANTNYTSVATVVAARMINHKAAHFVACANANLSNIIYILYAFLMSALCARFNSILIN